jgi:hypothetical protein
MGCGCRKHRDKAKDRVPTPIRREDVAVRQNPTENGSNRTSAKRG